MSLPPIMLQTTLDEDGKTLSDIEIRELENLLQPDKLFSVFLRFLALATNGLDLNRLDSAGRIALVGLKRIFCSSLFAIVLGSEVPFASSSSLAQTIVCLPDKLLARQPTALPPFFETKRYLEAVGRAVLTRPGSFLSTRTCILDTMIRRGHSARVIAAILHAPSSCAAGLLVPKLSSASCTSLVGGLLCNGLVHLLPYTLAEAVFTHTALCRLSDNDLRTVAFWLCNAKRASDALSSWLSRWASEKSMHPNAPDSVRAQSVMMLLIAPHLECLGRNEILLIANLTAGVSRLLDHRHVRHFGQVVAEEISRVISTESIDFGLDSSDAHVAALRKLARLESFSLLSCCHSGVPRPDVELREDSKNSSSTGSGCISPPFAEPGYIRNVMDQLASLLAGHGDRPASVILESLRTVVSLCSEPEIQSVARELLSQLLALNFEPKLDVMVSIAAKAPKQLVDWLQLEFSSNERLSIARTTEQLRLLAHTIYQLAFYRPLNLETVTNTSINVRSNRLCGGTAKAALNVMLRDFPDGITEHYSAIGIVLLSGANQVEILGMLRSALIFLTRQTHGFDDMESRKSVLIGIWGALQAAAARVRPFWDENCGDVLLVIQTLLHDWTTDKRDAACCLLARKVACLFVKMQSDYERSLIGGLRE